MVVSCPTAQALPALLAQTLLSSTLSAVVKGTFDQTVPFQCRITGVKLYEMKLLLSIAPTAQTSSALLPKTLLSDAPVPAPEGTLDQAVPFQCRISPGAPAPAFPTAQTSVELLPHTLLRMALDGALFGTFDQAVPSQ